MSKTLHFSGLNGIRAIAALAVVFSHTTLALTSFGLDSFLFGKNDDGSPKTTLLAGFGVSMFFALSGFLISYLLLEERMRGEINIRNFYRRRILRIWPLYYAYLIAVVATMIVYHLPVNTNAVFFYVFLMANVPFIFGPMIGLLSHYWSLGVEEQFYSFWPWIVKKSKSLLIVTVALCAGLFLLKCGFRFYDIYAHGGETNWPYNIIHTTRFHCMLIGAIGAILFFQRNDIFLRLTDNVYIQAISWIIIFLITTNNFHLVSFLDNEFISVVTVVIIIGQVQKKHRLINLENKLFDFIGRISYGIYIIHPLVIFYLSKLIDLSNETSTISVVLVYVVVFAITILMAYLSFEFFEKYFLKIKDRYATVRNTDSMHVNEQRLSRS